MLFYIQTLQSKRSERFLDQIIKDIEKDFSSILIKTYRSDCYLFLTFDNTKIFDLKTIIESIKHTIVETYRKMYNSLILYYESIPVTTKIYKEDGNYGEKPIEY